METESLNRVTETPACPILSHYTRINWRKFIVRFEVYHFSMCMQWPVLAGLQMKWQWCIMSYQ